MNSWPKHWDGPVKFLAVGQKKNPGSLRNLLNNNSKLAYIHQTWYISVLSDLSYNFTMLDTGYFKKLRISKWWKPKPPWFGFCQPLGQPHEIFHYFDPFSLWDIFCNIHGVSLKNLNTFTSWSKMSDGVLKFVLTYQHNRGLISFTMLNLPSFPPEIGDCGLG